jgi:hypothetical protein
LAKASDTSNTTNPSIYKFTVPAGREVILTRMTGVLTDGAISQPLFGGVSARTNGLKIYTATSGGTTIANYTTDVTVKKNSDWGIFAGPDADAVSTLGAGDDVFFIRWTFSKAGQPIALGPGESFNVAVQDDITSLTAFNLMVQGYYVK